jgi:hypothetical protein
LRIEPLRDPVDGAHHGELDQLRIARLEGALVDALLDDGPHALVELIALCNHALEEHGRQGFGIQCQRGAVELVENQVDEGEHQLAKFRFRARGVGLHVGHERQQHIERVLVTSEENLFLVLEVVVEVALGHLQGRGDFVNAGAVIAATAEGGRGALQDFGPAIGGRSLCHRGSASL